MIDYRGQVMNGMKGFIPFSELMKGAILDMIESGMDPAEAEKTIAGLCWEVTGDGGFEWINHYRELRLRTGNGSPATAPTLEPGKIQDTVSNDTLFERITTGGKHGTSKVNTEV